MLRRQSFRSLLALAGPLRREGRALDLLDLFREPDNTCDQKAVRGESPGLIEASRFCCKSGEGGSWLKC